MKTIKGYILQTFRAYVSEFRIILHDPGVLLFFVFLPLCYPVIYSLIYNPEVVREVKAVVVDHDRSAASRQLVRELDATQETHIIGYAADLTEARHAMNSHDCYAILEIPAGFGRNIGRGEPAEAVMFCEMSLLLRYRGFMMSATNVTMAMGAQIRSEKIDGIIPIADTLVTGDPLEINSVALGDTSSGFDSFIMPAIVILILCQCIVLAVGMMGGAMHENPALIRYWPINYESSTVCTMLGKTACYYTILVIPFIFLIHFIPVIFEFPMAGDFIQILAFLMPMVLACVFMGFCLQPFIRQREEIFVVWVVTSVFLLFLSGITWPYYAMPPVWKALADILPSTWGVQGFVKINSNGATLAQVSDCYRNLWILTGSYFVLAYLLHRFYLRPRLMRTLRQQ